MKQTGRKLTSWLLTLAMLVGLLPATVLPARANITVTTLTSSTGRPLSSGVYYVNESVTFTGSAGNPGLAIASGATVYIYVQADKTLTATGGNASGKTGGGAGILVPSGSTLYLLGEGSVVAKGGDAANGTAGVNGSGGTVNYINDNGRRSYAQGGNGGNGGNGGGGAGAGIGSNGGNGGNGGSGGRKGELGWNNGSTTGMLSATNGSAGGSGTAAAAFGSIYVQTRLSITATGGSGKSTSWGSNGSGGAISGTKQHISGGMTFQATGGGGGGGGQGGGAGANYGSGGTGGGGGGGGGGGAAGYANLNPTAGQSGSNGAGGKGGYLNMTSDWNMGPQTTGGTKGSGGSTGASVQPTSVNYYTVTFTDASANAEQSYLFWKEGVTVTVPSSYTPPVGKIFQNKWKVTTAGTFVGNEVSPPLTTVNEEYDNGATITIAPGTKGNIILTAVTKDVEAPVIDPQPIASLTGWTYGDAVAAASRTLSVAATVSDGGTLSYQWYSNTANSNSGGTEIDDATGTSYTVPDGTGTNAGTHYYYCVVTNTLSGGTNKTASSVASLTVGPKTVTLEWGAHEFTYDGTAQKPSASVSNLEGGDTCAVTVTGGETNSNAKAGNTNYTATATALSNTNYTLTGTTNSTQTFTIAQRPVTITAKPQSVELNAPIETGTDQVVCDTELLPATDSLTAITLTPTERDALTTTGTITPSAATIENGGADATDNYEITYVNGNLTVTKGNPVVNVTAPTASEIIYGDTLSMSNLSLDGKMKDAHTGAEVPGTFAWETGTTVPDATQGSPASYTVRFTPDESFATLYEATTIEVPVTVAKRVVELNWGNNAFTYNSEAQKPAATVTNLVTDRGDTTETVAVTVTGEQTDSNAKAGNTEYTATASGLTGDRAANYTLEGTTNPTQTFTIAQKAITITAQDQTAQCGDDHADGNENIKITSDGSAATMVEAAISAAVTVATLAEGDKLTSINLKGDTSAVAANLPLVADGAVIKDGETVVTGNYDITYVEANLLQVIPTRPMIKTGESVTAGAITYGQSLENSAITGAVMQDKNTSATVEGTFAWKDKAIKPAVSDSNSTKYIVVFTPSNSNDYSPTEIEVTVEVGKAPLTVTAEDKEMVYRTTVPALTYTVEGLVNNETASVALEGALTTTGSSTASVNTYDITQGDLTATANYTISTFNKGTLTIKKADQTAPAAKEGYTISGGEITVKTDKNTAANNETGYEVYEFTGAEDTTGTKKDSPVTIDAAKLYKIRWAGGDNYNASPWTDIATTANVTVTITPDGAAGSVALTNGGKYPISSSVTLNAAANTGYQFASWQDSSGKTLGYNAAYTFTLDGDTALKAVFVDSSKTVVQLPVAAATSSFTYDGTEKTGVTASDANCTLTNGKATDAGSYTATATLAEGNYIWADGTTDAKTFPWSIAKAEQAKPTVEVTGSNPYTITATPASGTVPQNPALVVYYTQDNTKPKLEWTPMPDGGITGAVGVYYFYTKGNNNYNDSEVATRSVGKPTVVSTLQPTGLATDGATLNGSVSDPDANIKGSGVNSVKYQWKRADATSWTEIETPTYTYESAKPFNATATLSGLTQDTEYLYRLVVTLKNDSELPGNTIRFRTPKVTPPTGSITVTVNSTPTGKDVVVSVEEGNDIIASQECKTDNSVTFTQLPDGFYNVVVRSKDGNYVETRMIAIQNGTGTATTFTIPSGKLATEVDIKDADTPPIAVEGLNDIITTAEKDDAAAGTKNVEVVLEVDKKETNELPAAEVSALNAVVVAGGKIDMYLDLSLYKTTTTLSGGGIITGSTKDDIGGTNTKVLEIAIPYADAKAKDIMVYRYHKGAASALTKVDARIANPSAADNGKFYVDKDNGYIFLYAMDFSTYAIGTPKPAPAPAPAPAPTGGGGGWFPTPTPTPTPTPAKDITDPTVTGVADWLITDDHIVYLNGYEDDTIRPNSNITRAEVSMIFYRLLKNKDVTITKSFTDVPDGEWYSQAVGVLSNLGILRGYEDGDFRPQNPITRAEFTAIATRFAKATNGTASFLDVPENHWAYGNIATASDYGWVNGYGNGYFGPNDSITRAEAATIVNHMLGRAADQEWVLANPDKIKYFADLQDPRKWYYLDMVEASNEHDFTKDNGEEKWKK